MPEDYEYVNGIEVLSKLCDEHGLEHWDSEAMACETHVFIDKNGNPHECWESSSGMVNVVFSMTPEQAVAATLGAGTCQDLGGTGANDEQVFNCSECGCVLSLYDRDGANTLCTHFIYDYPRYCPCCGREVMDE